MKIRSPLPRRRTRLEIIPLIDIMFFLLASFMMVSLQMQKVRTLKANLPTATVAPSSANPDVPVYISGDRDTLHGDMVKVYQIVRTAGIQTVAFMTDGPQTPATP